MNGYIRQLQKMVENQLSASVKQENHSQDTLETQFAKWFDSLPEISKNRPFSMAELEEALGTQGKYLSPVLLRLGWSRKRKWSAKGQYHRYWVPPL